MLYSEIYYFDFSVQVVFFFSKNYFYFFLFSYVNNSELRIYHRLASFECISYKKALGEWIRIQGGAKDLPHFERVFKMKKINYKKTE